ncbi:sodium:solute symporter family transporter [Mesomycoplasma neurolyticum]|uniref:Na(+)/glucose symporter n=1 Tax=Mesomycoplasma neurolyticum TaxID=2120 RepID=A0A449A4Y0_9BACT|nr:hypothetical protein [Mesomycoplasma neurolyticum]VEU59286.1 Na(+)/glucose symporter [Mesomycoplasma neurolyticum]
MVKISKNLHWIDWSILVIYLILIVGLGIFVWWIQKKKKETNSTKSIFTGGGKNPIIVVGLSIWATITSSLFFVNTAGEAATTNWMWTGANISLICITPFIAMFVIPFYRRIKETTAYAYLQKRFNYAVRAISSLSFIIFMIFRSAIVLFVPIVAITTIVDVDPYVMVVIVGLVVAVLTAFGGFKAVIWADATQGVILLFGIASVLISALVLTNYSSDTLQYQDILTRDSWKVNLAQGGISLLFIYNIINSMYGFMASQDVTQRYKGTRNISQIRKTLYISSALGIVTVLLFFGAGSALATYYSSQPETGVKMLLEGKTAVQALGLQKSGFMITFVNSVLGVGFTGVILASIFAASQSTISSGLSALSNSIVIDFVVVFNKKISEKKLALISKLLVLIFGGFAIAFSCLLIATKQNDLFNYFTGIIGLLNAPTVAVFVLGLYSKRTNSIGVLIAMLVAMIISTPLWVLSQKFIPESHKITFSGIWLTTLSFFTTLVVGFIVSKLTNKYCKKYQINEKNLVNRTMLTRTAEFKQLTKLESEIGKFESWVKKGLITKEEFQKVTNKIEELEKIVDLQTID